MVGSLKKKLPILSRRQFLGFLGVLAAAPLLPGCAWLDQSLAIATHIWPGYEPLFLARDKGWLDERRIQLVKTASATESLQALAEGKAHGAALTLDEVLKARARGLPLAVVMIFDISVGADMLIARSGIKQLSELKDRRIGVEPGTTGELILTEALLAAGLSASDVKLVTLNIDKHLDAWNSNQVDAITTYEPVASQLLKQEGVRLFDSRQVPDTIVDVLAIHNDALDLSHASAIKSLLATHFRTLDYLNRNPKDAAYRMSARLDLPAAEVLTTLKGLILPDLANNYRWLAGASPELLVCARKLSSIMVKSGALKQDDTLDSLINADFLPMDLLSSGALSLDPY
ncbi:MAG: substrate-binding domain-containing protein [Methylobacter sp.]